MSCSWNPLVAALGIALTALTAAAAEENALTVHEWGVFDIDDGQPEINAGLLADWVTAPPEIYRASAVIERLKARSARPNIMVKKPVIWLHAPSDHVPPRVHIEITPPAATPVLWWPWATATATSIAWDVTLVPPPTGAVVRSPQPTTAGAWYAELRRPPGQRVWAATPDGSWDEESFLYYDVAMPYSRDVCPALCPREAATPDDLTVTNLSRQTWADVMVVACTTAGIRVAHCEEQAPGAAVMHLVPVAGGDEAAHTTGWWQARLTATGLTTDEAASLLTCWQRGFFAAPGVHLLYRLPTSVYDRVLPLHMTPAPAQRVRVGIVHQHWR